MAVIIIGKLNKCVEKVFGRISYVKNLLVMSECTQGRKRKCRGEAPTMAPMEPPWGRTRVEGQEEETVIQVPTRHFRHK